MAVSEFQALDLFYAEIRKPGADVLAVLQVFAEIAIIRPADWDREAIRAQAGNHSLRAIECGACRGCRGLQWHHIIQVQFGGSNTPRNRIALCDTCHANVHPWLHHGRVLPPKGWTLLSDMVERAMWPGLGESKKAV